MLSDTSILQMHYFVMIYTPHPTKYRNKRSNETWVSKLVFQAHVSAKHESWVLVWTAGLIFQYCKQVFHRSFCQETCSTNTGTRRSELPQFQPKSSISLVNPPGSRSFTKQTHQPRGPIHGCDQNLQMERWKAAQLKCLYNNRTYQHATNIYESYDN